MKLCEKPPSHQGDWGEPEAKKLFLETIMEKCMKQALVLMGNGAMRENLTSIFQQFSASIKKLLRLEGILGSKL